jgi:hypothetical protein
MTWQISKQRVYSILMVNCKLPKPFSRGDIIIKKYGMALSIDDVAHELCVDKYDIQDIINANELTLTNIGTKQQVLVTSLINYIYKLNNQPHDTSTKNLFGCTRYSVVVSLTRCLRTIKTVNVRNVHS